MENSIATIIAPLDLVRAASLFTQENAPWAALGVVHITTDGDGTPTIWATDSHTAFHATAQGAFARKSDADATIDFEIGQIKNVPKSHKIVRIDVCADKIVAATYRRVAGHSLDYSVNRAEIDHDGAWCDASVTLRLRRDISYPSNSFARLLDDAVRNEPGPETTAEDPAYMGRVTRAAKIIGADAVSRAPRRSTDGARGATSYILGTRAGLVIAEALVMPLKLDLAPAAKNETEDAA